jgi:hypothetical protein
MRDDTPGTEESIETVEPEVDEAPADDAASNESNEDRWEFWAKASVALFGLMMVAWVLVFLRLDLFSVQVHAMVIPTLGALTLALLAWGLIRALFKPPAFRKSRTIAFVLLLATGWIGNRPFIAPPLATDDWQSDQRYVLPFEGEWMTLAGGPQRDRNYNATTAAIRYAYDFTKVVDGKKFALDGAKNEDFHCWGEPIYAPTGGQVVRVKNDVVDNTPGEVTSNEIFGNHVVIEAGESEYVFVWHLKHRSVRVKAGDEVSPSTVIGECGNSGRSVEPHVKVHAQTELDFPIAMGLPIQFSEYSVDGELVGEGMPRGSTDWEELDGQMVTNRAER